MHASATSKFQVRTKRGKEQHYKNWKQVRYFNIINIEECWRKISCTSEGPAINQSWNTKFPIAIPSQMAAWPTRNPLCLRNMCKGRLYAIGNVYPILRNGKPYPKYGFLCHGNFPLEEIQLSVNCCISIFSFNSPNCLKH